MAYTFLDDDPPGDPCESCGIQMTRECLDRFYWVCENQFCTGEPA